MFKDVLKTAVFSSEQLKLHLKGAVPEDLNTSEDNERCICYVLSKISRTAIVLSEGKLTDKKEVTQKALDHLFECS